MGDVDDELPEGLMEIIHLARIAALKDSYQDWRDTLDEEEKRDLDGLLKKLSTCFHSYNIKSVFSALYGTIYLLEVDHHKFSSGEDTLLKYEAPEG